LDLGFFFVYFCLEILFINVSFVYQCLFICQRCFVYSALFVNLLVWRLLFSMPTSFIYATLFFGSILCHFSVLLCFLLGFSVRFFVVEERILFVQFSVLRNVASRLIEPFTTKINPLKILKISHSSQWDYLNDIAKSAMKWDIQLTVIEVLKWSIKKINQNCKETYQFNTKNIRT